MDSFKEFITKYKGAIIGIIIAILILCTRLYQLIIAIVLIFLGFILTIFPLVLFLDKEISNYSINMLLINILGIFFIILSIKKIIKIKHT